MLPQCSMAVMRRRMDDIVSDLKPMVTCDMCHESLDTVCMSWLSERVVITKRVQ